jgi:hypothetical protein
MVRRSFLGLVVAVLLAYVATAASAQVILGTCALYEKYSWEWYLAGCWIASAIDVLFAPFVNGHSGFLIR